MSYRPIAVISLCVLFCGSFAYGESTLRPVYGVVQAYRKPSDDDLQWLFGNAASHIPNAAGSTEIVQAAYFVDRLAMMNRTFSIAQMSSDRLPPPAEAPSEATLAPLLEFAPRAFPPRQLPVDSSPVSERNAGQASANQSCSDAEFPDSAQCLCITCVLCGPGQRGTGNCQTAFYVPSMIGSTASFAGPRAAPFASSTMMRTRPNVVEHFNAEVQNRIWADYRSWSNAAAMEDAKRSVEQFSFGLEKRFLHNCSVEVRIPVIYQFASSGSDASTAVELGNVSLFAKRVLRRNACWTVACGSGISFPTAKDYGEDVKNRAHTLVSFVGVQWHPDRDRFGHFVVQYDRPVVRNVSSEGKIDGQQVIRTGIQLGRWIHRIDCGKRPCRFGAFAEINYAVVTDRGHAMNMEGAARSTLTAALGVPMVFGKLTCTNSLILPLTGGNRPFSAAYNLSLSRQF